MVETVFKTIKSECVWRTAFRSRDQASNAIGLYIEGFYNPQRRHSSLGYKTPPHSKQPSRLTTGRRKWLSTKSGQVHIAWGREFAWLNKC